LPFKHPAWVFARQGADVIQRVKLVRRQHLIDRSKIIGELVYGSANRFLNGVHRFAIGAAAERHGSQANFRHEQPRTTKLVVLHDRPSALLRWIG
jgi:hypothetical protein